MYSSNVIEFRSNALYSVKFVASWKVMLNVKGTTSPVFHCAAFCAGRRFA